MSMESDTTVSHGVTRPNSESKPKPKPKPQPLKPELTFKPIRVKSTPEGSREIRGIISPYDAIPPPKGFYGGNPVAPLDITDDYRPLLEELSKRALEFYCNKEGSGASFEFHDLVKCTFWSDYRPLFPDRPNTTEYYITFQAKGDPSNSPAIKNFQAKVLVDNDDKDKPAVVDECRIKI